MNGVQKKKNMNLNLDKNNCISKLKLIYNGKFDLVYMINNNCYPSREFYILSSRFFRNEAQIVINTKWIGKYGFNLDDTLLNKIKDFINNKAMELDYDHIVFWNDIISQMKSNYENIKYKEVVDYLVSIDLNEAKKKALKKYYKQNFFSILKRKLHI